MEPVADVTAEQDHHAEAALLVLPPAVLLTITVSAETVHLVVLKTET